MSEMMRYVDGQPDVEGTDYVLSSLAHISDLDVKIKHIAEGAIDYCAKCGVSSVDHKNETECVGFCSLFAVLLFGWP